MNDISFEQLDSYYFRKDRMRSCIQEVLDTVNGRNMKIRDLICEDGKVSAKKRDAFIDELLECLKIYIRYRLRTGKTKQESEETMMLNEKRVQCLSDFLCCSLDHLAKDQRSNLTDLINLSASVNICFDYIELLLIHFQKRLNRSSRMIREYSFDPDQYQEYAKLYTDDSAGKSADFVSSFLWYYFPIDGWEGLGDIMNFRYQMDASERQIDLMLEVLRRRNIKVPEKWLTDYARDKELYRNQKHHAYFHASQNSDIIAFWNFLSLQEFMLSSRAFENAVSGMVDVYTILHETTVLFDPERFYEVYDRLEEDKKLAQKLTGEKAQVK